MDDDITPEDVRYVKIYEHVSHEIMQKRDPVQIVQELKAEGFEENDAIQWVVAVASQVRSRMLQRSLFAMIPGLMLLVLGIVLRIENYNATLAYGAPIFETLLILSGAVLCLWGMAAWSKYRRT